MFPLLPFALLGLLAQEPAAPALSETDALRLEVLKLKVEVVRLTRESATCQIERLEQRVAGEVQGLLSSFETLYPGYSYDPDTGRLTKKPER